jgi:hypothetical protein
MRALLFAIVIAATTQASCKSITCAPGTIEQDDKCVAAGETVTTASCGPFTELQGDVCVPMFPPTECDPTTTTASTDPTTGVTTCIGTGTSAGCSGPFACPAPSAGTQTACGQIYDIETGQPFTAASPTGALCGSAMGSASGPCGLAMQAFDAVAFASDPVNTLPLTDGGLDIDDCGRFRLKSISQPSGPLIALGLDDASAAQRGPTGQTNSVGVAFSAKANSTVPAIEHFIAKSTTTDGWTSSGGPAVSDGFFVALYRAHVSPTTIDNQPGVTVVKDGSPDGNATYFGSDAANRTTIDPAATATGLSGAALVANGSLTSFYTGAGGLGSNCQWEPHPGAKVPEVVFVQIFRPEDDGGTCAQ